METLLRNNTNKRLTNEKIMNDTHSEQLHNLIIDVIDSARIEEQISYKEVLLILESIKIDLLIESMTVEDDNENEFED